GQHDGRQCQRDPGAAAGTVDGTNHVQRPLLISETAETQFLQPCRGRSYAALACCGRAIRLTAGLGESVQVDEIRLARELQQVGGELLRTPQVSRRVNHVAEQVTRV